MSHCYRRRTWKVARFLLMGVATLGAAGLTGFSAPATAPVIRAFSAADTVHVAPPTGEREADRASIVAALEEVEPGGTVLFAPGTYLIGPGVEVTVPQITLLGHPAGTTIRGCPPDEFVPFVYPDSLLTAAPGKCNALGLSGGAQTIRGLTFEYAWHGLLVGCCLAAALDAQDPPRDQAGGHLIEDNTFRFTPNGIRVIGESSEPTVIRDNRFVDVYHAIGINGRTVHFLDNEVSVNESAKVPISTHPGDAVNVSPWGQSGDHSSCAGNVIAGNRIDGYTHGIRIVVHQPGTSCRRNVVRDNTIKVRRVRFVEGWFGVPVVDEADSTVVGVPVGLINYPAASGEAPEPGEEAVIEDNLIEGNRIIGAEGVAIEVVGASRNWIVDNTVRDVRPREPFPGNVLLDELVEWGGANGSGIWLSPGSNGNQILGNKFEDVVGPAIVLEGSGNQVIARDSEDGVRDVGERNRVTVRIGGR